jgi:enoyl-CoA hydratase/carnithine racemase
MLLLSEDTGRVRVLTLNRPEALNAFNSALYDAVTEGLLQAAHDDAIAVVVLTGAGRAYSAGADLGDMARGNDGNVGAAPKYGFGGFLDALADFPKPLIMAVNGLGVGIGATMLAYADLVFMASTARLRCPFTSLGVAPEAASSITFPRLMGRQHAMWMLSSSDWFSAEECHEMGLAWKVCDPDELMTVVMEHAQKLAAMPITSLVETKQLVAAPLREGLREARDRENAAFARLLGRPANRKALLAFQERRAPDFTKLPPA